MVLTKFSNIEELMKCAKNFIDNKVNTLENVVNHCLREFPDQPNTYATFPAIIYCFSTIDLLGALYKGNATSNSTKQSKQYMMDIMGYTDEQTFLLQKIFRHKLVHLAEPKPVAIYNGQYITWMYWHDNPKKHLKIKQLPEKDWNIYIPVPFIVYVICSHSFNISISDFVGDIKGSVREYLSRLENTPKLQQNFEKAISQIYDNNLQEK